MSKKPEMERLLKLYALAMRGEGGEAENARRFLNDLMKKAGVTLSDVERAAKSNGAGEEKVLYTFSPERYAPGLENVVSQLVFSFGLREERFLNIGVYRRPGFFRKKQIIAKLNRAEYALLMVFFKPCCEAYFKTYKNMLERHRRERRDLADGFIEHNDLYDNRPIPRPESPEQEEPYTPPSVDWRDMEDFSHEHDRVLEDSRLQLEGGAV